MNPTRRDLLRTAFGAPLMAAVAQARTARIDRKALVRRHDVVLRGADLASPLQVGNGEFAVTVDVTGLQTFADAHDHGMPLGTMAQWAWHTFPAPPGVDVDDIYTLYDSHGRQVPYADGKGGYASDAKPRAIHPAVWRRVNPHRIDLARVGFVLVGTGGRFVALEELADTRQQLDLWTGTIESRFSVLGQRVTVRTLCHPEHDILAVRIDSSLLAERRLGVAITFPFPAGEWTRTVDWTAPDSAHRTVFAPAGDNGGRFDRQIDDTRYTVAANWSRHDRLEQRGVHQFELSVVGDALELTLAFSPDDTVGPFTVDSVGRAAATYWDRFWSQGGAIDLSASTHPQAPELERRIVLSQYLTAVNCAGSVPPQETGLVTNSWYGKHHLEMHWWHAAHFALWSRPGLLERSLPWYRAIVGRAREIAARQGYKGARWPKQVGVDGRESPSAVSPFLIWQQPHYIFLSELLYRVRPTRETLQRHADLVFATAEFMASFAARSEETGDYVLGPPVIPAQETYGPIRQRVVNPTFELAYWAWGLTAAQTWRERLGLPRQKSWDVVASGLSRPMIRDGVYAAIGSEPFTERSDHPSMLAAYGMLPQTPLIDREVMRRTFADVRRRWDWSSAWGWDYPMMAMTAARLVDAAAAIDALLMDSPKNRYLANGHCFQSERLPLYLPANGGLLYAAGMMAAGWDGAAHNRAPGFPADGQWTVRSEGLLPAP